MTITTYVYNTAGCQQPVFLCPKATSARIYVDVPHGCDAALEYSYDVVAQGVKRDGWLRHAAGNMQGIFADELVGITAVRLVVHTPNKPIILRVEPRAT